jgi:radical SAM-linked protein
MLKLRIRFSKTGTLRFIGHLDFLRVFQQTIRRAGLPAAFSQGFNPHLLISFALPLPLGMESLNDYADITLENADCDSVIKKLSDAAPGGLIILGAKPAEDKAASVTAAADYTVKGKPEKTSIESILNSERIIVAKKTKKGIKDTDIRPDILNMELSEGNVLMRLSAGSAGFLNPMILAGLLFEEPCVSRITRTELYKQTDSGELLSL